jgi:hypothetical protein
MLSLGELRHIDGVANHEGRSTDELVNSRDI